MVQSFGERDQLSIDITRDMERIDSFMTQILRDKELWQEFFRDPNGIFTRFNIHPPTTNEINTRANRVFYATLTNQKLINLILDTYSSFQRSLDADSSEAFAEGLQRGELSHRPGLDLEAADLILRNPQLLRQVCELGLYDLNSKGLLSRTYSGDELDDYITSYVEAVTERRSVRELPKLEEWDDNYGIGMAFAFASVEVGALTTAAAAAEFGVAFTVAAAIAPFPSIENLLLQAIQGNEASVRASFLLSRLLSFTADLTQYVQIFER
jgi:hypothetical protein